jgi:hypothetical protein
MCEIFSAIAEISDLGSETKTDTLIKILKERQDINITEFQNLSSIDVSFICELNINILYLI